MIFSHERAPTPPGHFEGHFQAESYRMSDVSRCPDDLAGVVGFEPTIHGTKNRCLTTWLHPNAEALTTRRLLVLQDLKSEKFG